MDARLYPRSKAKIAQVSIPVALLLFCGVLGCAATGKALTRTNLGIESNSQTKDIFVVGTTQFPVVVIQKAGNGSVSETIQDDGEDIEQEKYKIDDSGLDLIEASDDSFDPPLPLLQFPARAGQSYDWSGKITEAGMSRPASAKIALVSDELHSVGKTEDCICAKVDLSISSAPTPAKRTFQFWFVPGGLAKRVFGLGTSRVRADISL